MTTTYPLTIDSFDTHVDNVDDVMAADVNNLNDAVVALETAHRDYALMRVKNTSGSTVAANDVGYIDEAGEFKLNTTDFFDANWAVVVEGAANNADIIVTNKGLVTVVCNGNVSIGDYLYLSTTTKQVQPQSYVRPEVLGVAKTANSSGAGGTCEALLLTGKTLGAASNTNTVYRSTLSNDSDFVGTIATLPGGAVLTYAVTSGDELVLQPLNATQLAKLRLYNSTRSTYALIDDSVPGTNTTTLTANVPGDWQVGDTITPRSQTNTNVSGASYYFDYEVTSTDIPSTSRGLMVQITWIDTGAASERLIVHTWEAFAAGKRQIIDAQVAGVSVFSTFLVPLVQNRFTAQWTASGAGTALWIMALTGLNGAAP